VRISILVGCWLAIALSPGRTGAQPAPTDVGVFFDRYENPTSTWAPPYTTTNQAFVKVFQPIAGCQVRVEFDPRLIIFAFHPGNPGDDCVSCCEWRSGGVDCTWGFGGCSHSAQIALITYGYWDAEATDMTICVRPTDPSLLDPPMPSYLTCTFDETVAFTLAESGMGAYPDGCGVVNPTAEPPVVGQEASWGALKARFDPREDR
jgi:hypothetical protein